MQTYPPSDRIVIHKKTSTDGYLLINFRKICAPVDSASFPALKGLKKIFKFSLFHKCGLEIPFSGWTQCPGLVDREPFHEPTVFLSGKHPCLRRAARPLKTSGIQPHIKQDKTVFIMIQCFEPVCLPAAEKIQCVCVRVHLVNIPDYRHEAIDGKPHICTPCYQAEL